MKKQFYRALLAIALLVVMSQGAKSQVYGEFEPTTTVVNSYVPVTGGTVIPSTQFLLPPSSVSSTATKDDGYYNVTLPFAFEYNGDVYNNLWICVNGFVQFLPVGQIPNSLPQKLGNRLFIYDNSSVAYNVIAPFWGDHYYRDGADQFANYKVSSIVYQTTGTTPNRVFTVEWKDIQVNKNVSDLQSSIANFQVKLYESPDPNSKQGDIEFCYGQIGGNSSTTLTTVVTKGASVGIKGEFGDYVNGLFRDANYPQALTSTTLTDPWTPSGGFTNQRIKFTSKRNFNIDEWWGDGDADFSKAQGKMHYGMPQNRFVSINDVRTLLKAIAVKKPLDSLRRRAAYHGDVTHNGRFYYASSGTTTTRTAIASRDLNYADNLPTGISSIKLVYYEANEFDAATILNYLSAKIPSLPWRYDTVPQYGKEKFEGPIANNIKIGDVKSENGNVLVPIFLNGRVNGALGVKFDLNGEVVNVYKNTNLDNALLTDFDGNRVVLAGAGEYNDAEAIAFVEYKPLSNGVKLEDISFNDNKVGNITTIEAQEETNLVLSNTPNPFVAETQINLEIPVAGIYNLTIYDMYGKAVKVLANNFMNAGNVSLAWDGKDSNNESVPAGMYVAKLSSGNSTYSVKMMLNK